jgi:hypothetical protein
MKRSKKKIERLATHSELTANCEQGNFKMICKCEVCDTALGYYDEEHKVYYIKKGTINVENNEKCSIGHKHEIVVICKLCRGQTRFVHTKGYNMTREQFKSFSKYGQTVA